MANYDNLIASIKGAIKNNNTQAITGQVLQDAMIDMVSQLGKNYAFGGVATPSTNPDTPTTNTFYIATEAGTYTNMGGVELSEGDVATIVWNGSAWVKQKINIAGEAMVNAIADVVNTRVATLSFASGGYESKAYRIFAGRRYRIVNSTVDQVKFLDAGLNAVGTANKGESIYLASADAVEIRGSGGELVIEPLDSIQYTAFQASLPHGTNAAVSAFVKEIYINAKYDSYKLYSSVSNNWVQLIGVKDGAETTLSGYQSLNNIESNKPFALGDYAFAVLNKDFVNLGDYVKNEVINTSIELNPIIGAWLANERIDSSAEMLEEVGSLVTNTTVTQSGSYYQTYIANLKKGDQILVTLKSAPANVQFDGLPDASNTSVKTYLFKLAVGETILYTATADFEGIRYAAAGNSEVTFERYDSAKSTSWNHVFYCGKNRYYTKLTDAIKAAELFLDSTLYVDEGTYDIVEELGSAYFEGLTSGSTMSGIKLCNRIHIIFTPKSKVISHYGGSNQYAMSLYSPFNAGPLGFSLEGLTLEASRCRYAVHDEYNGLDLYCESRYKNCYMSLDNSNNTAWPSESVIGGGLGANTLISIEGCYFKTTKTNGVGIYYHQSNDTSNNDFRSVVSVKNNYCEKGGIMFQMSRENAASPTFIYVVGNSVPSDSGVNNEGYITDGTAFTYNKVIAWNNDVR